MRIFRCLCLAGALVSIATVLLPVARSDELPDAIVEAAKKEREVVLYGGIPGPALRPLRELFEKRYDIRISNWHGDSEDLLKRAAADDKRGRANFDVAVGGDSLMAALDAKGYFEPFEPPSARGFSKQLL
ncbi:MAG TPA: hypothetical protein VGH16_14830, partial [Candidatus Binatia bacterium]